MLRLHEPHNLGHQGIRIVLRFVQCICSLGAGIEVTLFLLVRRTRATVVTPVLNDSTQQFRGQAGTWNAAHIAGKGRAGQQGGCCDSLVRLLPSNRLGAQCCDPSPSLLGAERAHVFLVVSRRARPTPFPIQISLSHQNPATQISSLPNFYCPPSTAKVVPHTKSLILRITQTYV